MRHTIVRYTVKPGHEEPNAELVRAVYRELTQLAPTGFRYATYRLDDGRTFLHVAELEDGATVPLPGLAAFRAFQHGIEERCESGPDVRRAQAVGHYRH